MDVDLDSRRPRVATRWTRRAILAVPVVATLTAAVGCASQGSPAAAPTRAAVPASATKPSAAVEKLSITYNGPGMVFAPFDLGIHQKFFAEAGVNLDWSYARGGPQVIAALRGGSVDFIGTTIDLELDSLTEAGDTPFQMVASLTREPPYTLVADKEVTTLKGIEEKTVGVYSLGSGDQVISQYLFQKGGIDPKKVKFVPLGADNAKVAALIKGDVTAVIVGEPARTILVGRGMNVLLDLFDPTQRKKYLGGGYQWTGLVTRPDTIAKRSEAVQKMVDATIRSCAFIATHDGKAIVGALPKTAILGGDPARYATVLDEVKGALYSADGKLHADEVARVREIQQNAGILPAIAAKLKLTEFYTNRFVDQYGKAHGQ